VSRSDDLAPLLAAAPAGAVGFRQGTVIAWDPLTAANTIDVGGSTFSDLSILNTSEALLLGPGSVVGILTTGTAAKSWFILGRVTVPGTPDAATALQAIYNNLVAANAIDQGTVTGTSYTDLSGVGATVGPIVTTQVGNSGKVIVFLSAQIYVGENQDGAINGYMSYQVNNASTGALISAPSDSRNLEASLPNNINNEKGQWWGKIGVAVLHVGLTPGQLTFTGKYRAGNSGSGSLAARFADRTIIVMPF
jgi:hypothetical protein